MTSMSMTKRLCVAALVAWSAIASIGCAGAVGRAHLCHSAAGKVEGAGGEAPAPRVAEAPEVHPAATTGRAEEQQGVEPGDVAAPRPAWPAPSRDWSTHDREAAPWTGCSTGMCLDGAPAMGR